jgi:hypothetical protein
MSVRHRPHGGHQWGISRLSRNLDDEEWILSLIRLSACLRQTSVKKTKRLARFRLRAARCVESALNTFNNNIVNFNLVPKP